MSTRIDIYIPDRLGDAVLSLPAVLCLKQLINCYGPFDAKVRLFVPPALKEAISKIDLFETATVGWPHKLMSWLAPADHAFFLYSSHQKLGLHAKESYGWQNPFKKLVRYTHHMPCLKLEHCERELAPELLTFLKNRFNFSVASMRYFGMCTELGYSPAQIMEVFEMTLNSPVVKRKPNTPYLVFSMEAGYNSSREAQRRWEPENFFQLAKDAYDTHGLKSVFIGLETIPVLPKVDWISDQRGQLDISTLLEVLSSASGYIGNDSGPLHLANWVQTSSFGIYLSTTPYTYGPIFSGLNSPVQNPLDVAEVLPAYSLWLNRVRASVDHPAGFSSERKTALRVVWPDSEQP